MCRLPSQSSTRLMIGNYNTYIMDGGARNESGTHLVGEIAVGDLQRFFHRDNPPCS